jgi:prevent-host-death family protein
MISVTIHQAKTQLSRLIQTALRGGKVIITRNHEPVVKLVPLPGAKVKRRVGGAKGKVRILPGFDEPLEDFSEYVK